MVVQAKRLSKEIGEISETDLKQSGNQLLLEEHGSTYPVTLIMQTNNPKKVQRKVRKLDDSENESEDEENPESKGKSRATKVRKLDDSESESEDEENPKSRGKGPTEARELDDSEDEIEEMLKTMVGLQYFVYNIM